MKISGGQLAKRLGYSSPSGYLKYEQEKHLGDRLIPDEVIRRLIPVMRGAGSPPITTEELLAISDVKQISRPVERAYVEAIDDSQGLLPVSYRVESGVYIRANSTRSLGTSRIGSTPEFPSSSQFVAALAENIPDVGPPGSQLHCLRPSELNPKTMNGKRVLVGASADSDLVELVIGRVGSDGSEYSLDGLPIEGCILGVIIGTYRRE